MRADDFKANVLYRQHPTHQNKVSSVLNNYDVLIPCTISSIGKTDFDHLNNTESFLKQIFHFVSVGLSKFTLYI